MRKTLLYLTYGTGRHVDQLTYSVRSALDFSRGDKDYHIVVYAEDPAAVSGLAVDVVPLSRDVLAHWAGSFGYIHRRKIIAVRDALQRFGGRVVFCDTDTYFRKSPRTLFGRLGRGRSLMHIREGRLRSCNGDQLAAFLRNHDLRTLAGQRWDLTPESPMFNSGVIGLDEADAPLVDEVIYLADQLYSQVPVFNIEQFAFAACLASGTRLSEAYDTVYHYWRMSAPFTQHVSRVLHDSTLTDEQRLQTLMLHRPAENQKLTNRFEYDLPTRVRARMRRLVAQASPRDVLDTAVSVWSRYRQRR